MDRHTMALQAQAGATPRVTLHIMWIIIDTLPQLRQGAYIQMPTHMSHLQGTTRIFTDTLHRARLGAMTRVHMHTSLHQGTLRIDIDMHLREIAIAIVHLMIVIVIDMSLPHGTKRTVIVVCPLAHRR